MLPADKPTPGSTPETPPPPSPKPPKGPSARLMALLIAITLIALGVGAVLQKPIRAGFNQSLQLIGFGDHDHAEHAEPSGGTSGRQYYTCGMHPWVILPKPGTCPICQMTLTPLDPAKFTGQIAIDPVIVQNMGVRIQPVVEGPLTKTIRTVGTVDYNETRVRDVNTKINGWIEKLYVDFLGMDVQAGQPLFDLYSPELYAAQEEYLLAIRHRPRDTPAGTDASVDLVESARTRLAFFDITDEQIAKLEETGKPAKTMTVRSPHTGTVIGKEANEGMKIGPGMRVFRIADLSSVWVMVTLYEYQLPYVALGQKAVMSLPYLPGQTFEGKIVYIYPYVDPKTREVQVRLEFDNPDGLLKPDMFANVTLHNTLAQKKTLAPRSAIIDTGERQVAFVSQGEGKFEPRDVQMGIETEGGMVEIISGLKPGEMVVTSGQFLLDSEAKLREALAKMMGADLAAKQPAAAPSEGKPELDTLPEEVASKLSEALQAYFGIGEALAGDTLEGIPERARQVAQAIDALLQLTIPDRPHFWHEHEEAAVARGSALKLVQAASLEDARLEFATLSQALQQLLVATGVPGGIGREVQALHCPMYREGQGGTIWLQPAGEVRNPYMAPTMLGCFDKRSTLPAAGPAADAAKPGARADEPKPYPLDVCLVTDLKLGAMGDPVQLVHEGQVFEFCCDSCPDVFRKDPAKFVAKLKQAVEAKGHAPGSHGADQ